MNEDVDRPPTPLLSDGSAKTPDDPRVRRAEELVARLCRWPDPPQERWQRKPGGRRYRSRYVGLVRQIARKRRRCPACWLSPSS